MNSKIAFVTDLRTLKIYSVEDESPTLRLADEATVGEWAGHFADEVTDQAGAFPSGSAPGRANSIAERHGILEEQEKRSIRNIASKITGTLREMKPARWSLVAAPEINGAILDQLPASATSNLEHNVEKNLVKASSSTILVNLHGLPAGA